MPELIQLLSVKSISLNFPAKGTAGFERPSVNGFNLAPAPPASIMANTLFNVIFPLKFPQFVSASINKIMANFNIERKKITLVYSSL